MAFQRIVNKSSGAAEVVSLPLPAGIFFAIPFGGSAPIGTLLCDGSGFNKRRYPDLHKALSTGYGSEAGATGTLPDFRGRGVYGVGTHASVAVRGANDGLAASARTPNHTHAPPAHSHSTIDHDHSAPSHDHPAEAHQHTIDPHYHGIPAHAHGVSGTAAATNGKPGATGGNTVADDTHAHGAGSYVLDNNPAPSPANTTSPGSSGQTAGPATSAATAGNTAAADTPGTGPATGGTLAAPATIGFAAVQWVVTTGRPRRGFLRRS